MSILKSIFDKIVAFLLPIYHFLDRVTTPGNWLHAFFGRFKKDYKPSVRVQMLFFGVVFGLFVITCVGLALQVCAACGAAGVVPLGTSAWIIISVVAATVADPHFQVFHTAMPVTQLLCSATFAVLFFSSLHHFGDSLAAKRIFSIIDHAFFGIKRGYKAAKAMMMFKKGSREA